MKDQSSIIICEGDVRHLVAKLLLAIVDNMWYENRINKNVASKVIFARNKGEAVVRRFMEDIKAPTHEKEHYYALGQEICGIMQSEQMHEDILALSMKISTNVVKKINFLDKYKESDAH
jgi:hypothetical protein